MIGAIHRWGVDGVVTAVVARYFDFRVHPPSPLAAHRDQGRTRDVSSLLAIVGLVCGGVRGVRAGATRVSRAGPRAELDRMYRIR